MGFLGIKFKSKNQAPRKPHVAADDLVSNSRFRGIYGLCEGEIYGLADGAKSIRLDGTPIVNSSGQPNFAGVNYEFRTGTVQQEYIKGFASVENEINIGVELRHDRPFVRQINNAELSAVRVRLNFNSLRQQHDNGDITGYAIEYAIDLQVEGGTYQEVLKNTVRGKASSGFKKSHRIDLPKGKRWTLRVRRITPNRNSELIADTTTIDAITEIIDAKLRYPCTALLGLSYDAKTFNNIAKVAVRLKGSIIRVPSNYNPETRTYNGLWDGAFKKAYSNNPAWVFYDVCTHERYGLGNQLAGMVDKWRLYQIGQYCDELVDDGKGGKEPRFTVNVYLQKDEEAYRVLQSLASVFRGMNFWDGQNVIVDSDTPKDAVYTFTPANVVGGEFNYSGTRARDRHNIAKVAWDNPDNDFKTEYEFVKDEAGIAKYGIHQLELNAFGCTSQGQAQRAGLWALKSEQLETRSVTFKTGLQGFIPQVGQVINIADNVFAGRAISGRIIAVNGKQITLDRPAGKVGDTFTANHDGIKTAKIILVKNSTITLDKSLDLGTSDVWAIISDDLKLMQFKVLAVKQNDDSTFEINALQHEPQKYQAIDSGANITQATLSVLQATLIEPPSSVTLTSQNRTHQGQNMTTLTIAWSQVVGAVAYLVQWRKDDGNWQTLPPVSGQSVDIDGVYQGRYLAQVIAVDAFDNQSLAAISPLTPINGKQGRPPKPTAISASGGLFSMAVSWTHAKGSEDANYTEVQVSPDGRSNIATLGQFAYPTNKHEITGLQGNLTQFYRARIVDKLGNASDWTAWASGTTSANAGKLLDMLGGQISQSQLAQSLSTQITKIGTIETQSNTAKTAADQLRSALANAQRTLDQASQSINTERTRISGAIRDINALQADKNAKTQELVNLKNTVGGHTTSLRDLLVTTGDLSQRYTQLKTQTDKGAGEITTIKQTQSGQATEISTLKASSNNANTQIQALNQSIANEREARSTAISGLNSRFDTLAIGGRNLLLATSNMTNTHLWQFNKHANQTQTELPRTDSTLTLKSNNQAWVLYYQGSDRNAVLADELVGGQTYILSFEARVSTTAEGYIRAFLRQIYQGGGDNTNLFFTAKQAGVWERFSRTFVLQAKHANHLFWQFIMEINSTTAGQFEFRKLKLERGTIATDWTPAPEDTEQDFAQTNASMNTMRETLTNADKALSQRIDTMDSEYKAADQQTSAKLGQLEKTISDKDGSTAQRISQLQAEYSALNARTDWRIIEQQTDLNTLKEQGKYFIKAANNPNAPANNWLYVEVDVGLSNKRIKQTVWIDNQAHQRYIRLWIESRWSDWEQTPSFADVANKASQAALTAEQNARAAADRAHAESLRQLNSRVDGNASRITTVERTANDTKQALAVAQSQLSASYTNLDNKVNNLSIGGRNLLPNTRLMGGAWQVASHDGRTQKHHDGEMVRIAGNTQDWKHLAIYIDKAKALEWLGTSRDFVLSVSIRRVSQTPNKLISLALRKGLTRGFSDNQLGGNVNPTNQWTRYSIKGTITPDDLQYLYVRFEWWDDSEYEFKHPKLEFGTIATDYTPAPEDNDALIDEFKQVQATKEGAIAQKLSTLQTTVNGQTASIEQHAQSLNGLQAQWTLKMQTGGVVGGIGLAGNNGVIDFAINANKFYIAPPTGGKGDTPFVVLTSPQVINGVRVPSGTYIKSAFIQDGSIDIAKINKASINSLSALSANIGHFKSAQSGARLEIKDSVLLVYDANNTLRVRLGLW